MTIKTFCVLCLATWVLTVCFSMPTLKDPFGVYEAKVTMNDRNAEARETIARYDRDARITEAEEAADAKVSVTRAWTGMLPTIAVILAAGVMGVVYLHWNGRITLERIKRGELGQREVKPYTPSIDELIKLADCRNQQFKVINGVALLIDKSTGEIVKQRTL